MIRFHAYRGVTGKFKRGDRVRHKRWNLTGTVVDMMEHRDDPGDPEVTVEMDNGQPDDDYAGDKDYMWEHI